MTKKLQFNTMSSTIQEMSEEVVRGNEDSDTHPSFDTSRPEDVDWWLGEFENVMVGYHIPRNAWVRRFMECPKVSQDVRSYVAGTASIIGDFSDLPYAQLRKSLLEKYGPLRPCSYIMHKIHSVRGDSVTETRDKLQRLMRLYNRAAEDEGRTPLSVEDMCYSFLTAVPEAYSTLR